MTTVTPEEQFASLLDAATDYGLTFVDPQPPTDRYTIIDGLPFHSLDWGIAGQPAAVLVHGWATTGHTWDFFSLGLRQRYHVHAFDLRGHGDSAWAPDGDYDRERYAADLVGFIEQLPSAPDADGVVLVGHSLGGLVSLLAAPQLTRPLRALIIVDSPLLPTNNAQGMRSFVQGQDTFPTLEAMADYVTRFNPRRRTARLLMSLRHNTKQLPDGQWTWKYDPVLRGPSRGRANPLDFSALWQSLRDLPCPILVIRASDRSYVAEEAVAQLTELAPRVQVVTVPQSGHSVMGDNPVVFAQVVSAFLDGQPLPV